MRLGWVLGLVGILLHTTAVADYSVRDDVKLFIDEMVTDHDFDRQALLSVFTDAKHKESIINAISRPAERTKKWHEYRDIFLDETRIEQGVKFWNEHAGTLSRAQQVYSVPPEIIVAILGVETRYGKHSGGYRVLDALTTLAFDYPPRVKFFRSELREFLILSREENKNPRKPMGSYAGAMGFGQFMPSSFRAYAVDFDEDGLRDIWTNPVDAIGSVGSYFKQHGWAGGEDVVLRALSVDDEIHESRANTAYKPHITVGQLKQFGSLSAPLDDSVEVALFRMQGEDDIQYWLGLHNFYVITRYNHSRLYALAVYQLATEIFRSRNGALATTTTPIGAGY